MMQWMELVPPSPPTAPAADASTILVVSPHAALTTARTAGVRLFERRPPVHTVLLGRCRIEVAGRCIDSPGTLAIPANVSHTLTTLPDPFAGVAYLDARRYRFDDAQRLAEAWRGFVPGQDDLREAMGDALAVPARHVDARLLRALAMLESDDVSVAQAALRVGLSESRLTHLMTETLGAPPRSWRIWLRLGRALRETLFAGANLTQAAHRAGFADSAHFTRSCKQLMGVRPAQMLPRTVYAASEP
jgi:AraC-like DNA-binding protein